MTDRRTGSRYLYEPFDVANERISASERVQDERWNALERRLEALEDMLERLDRRLWLAVAGVMTFVLSRGVAALIQLSQV